jgi:outer membrane receptor for ferrienterochelin and colicins
VFLQILVVWRIFAAHRWMFSCTMTVRSALWYAVCPFALAFGQPTVERVDTLNYQTPAIVVTGTRAETPIECAPVRVERINGQQAQGTAISTVGELLREQAGVLIAPGSVRSGVQLMGLGPDYTLVLVDGQPLTGRVGGVIDLERISVGNVERIEIVRGPLSSLYGGDALAGVINIITKRPDDGYRGRVQARYLYHGPAETQLEQSYGTETFEAAVFGTVRRIGAFDVVADSERFAYPDIEDGTLSGKLRWMPHHTLRATLNGRLFSSTTRGALLQAQGGQITTLNGSLTMLDRSVSTGLEWRSPIGRWTLQLYGTAYREGYAFANDASNDDSFERRTTRSYVQFDRFVGRSNRAMAGVEFLYDDASGARYPGNPLYRTVAAFAQWEGNPSDRFSYALSLRSDWTSAFGTPRSVLLGKLPALPRLSLRYMLTPHVALNATVGEGFKTPDMRQLYIRFSPTGVGYQLLGVRELGLDLKPEQSLSVMAGTTFDWDTLTLGGLTLRQAMLDVLLFFNRVRDMIEYYAYQQSPLVFTYRNVAAVQTYGILVTASAGLNWGPHLLGVRASYQWLAAYDERVLDAIARGTAGYLVPSTGEYRYLRRDQYLGLWYRPFHTATARVDWQYQPLNLALNVRGQYVGAFGDMQRASNPDIYDGTQYLGQVLDSTAELVPRYWLISLGLEKHLRLGGTTLTLAIGVNNLLDVVRPRYVPTLIGRQGFCSVQCQW